MKPASARQLEKLRQFDVEFESDITMEDASLILKAEIRDRGIIGDIKLDLKKITQAIAAESEGDPMAGGKQYS